MLSLVLLALILESVASFTVPGRWLSARTATRRPTVACSGVIKPDEVYVGNLPPSFDVSQLSNMLQLKGVTGCRDVSVSTYGTSDGEKFGSIKFDSNRLAAAAVRQLSGVRVGEVEVDVSLMPNVPTIRVCVDGTDDENMKWRNRLREVLPRAFYARIKPIIVKDQLNAIIIECKSLQLTSRVLQILSKTFNQKKWPWKLCEYPQLNQKHQILLHNLHPSLKQEGLEDVMKSLLGHNLSCRVPLKFDGSNRGHAFLIFDTQEQANTALERLQGIKLMDRPISVTVLNQDESKVMFLGNVDPLESTESIERLCRDALGGSEEIEVSVTRLFGSLGNQLPFCNVKFDSTEARDKCMSVLNGTRWGDRVLYCFRCGLKQPFPMLYIKSFPWSAYDNNPLRLLDSLIGEKCVKGMRMNGKHRTDETTCAFVTVYTEDQAARAIQRLNGQVVDGITLRVERSIPK